jgi:hypothetical protein
LQVGTPSCSVLLSRSRYRVVLPAWDQQLPTLIACLDTMVRRIGGAPAYLLTDNPRTVTIDRIADMPARHPDVVAAARHYGCVMRTCEPFDPVSKGGVEHTVKIAKADLVPTEANLLPEYASFAELEAACSDWCEQVNARPHRAIGVSPTDGSVGRGVAETACAAGQPAHSRARRGTAGELGSNHQLARGPVFDTGRHQARKVWCRVSGDELVVVARTKTGFSSSTTRPPRIPA